MTGNFTVSVRDGQTSSQLAQIYGVSEKSLPAKIKTGTTITIPLNKAQAEARKEKESKTQSDEMQSYLDTRYALEEIQAKLQEYKASGKIDPNKIAEFEKEIDRLEDKRQAQLTTGTVKSTESPVLEVFGKLVISDDGVSIKLKKDATAGEIKKTYNLKEGTLRRYVKPSGWGVNKETGEGYQTYDDNTILKEGTLLEFYENSSFKKEQRIK